MKKGKCIDCGSVTSGKGLRCRSCAVKKQHADKPRTGKNHPRYKHGLNMKENIGNCIDCGKKLKTPISKRCYSCNGRHINLGRKRDLHGSKNPMFGKGKYTEKEAIVNGAIINWYKWKVFRLEILERDNNTCQICTGKGNTIHHIKERKDYPELCWQKDNVITVCRGCHANIDGHNNPKGNNQYVKR